MFYSLAATRKQKEFGIGSDCDRMAFTKSNENTNVILRVSAFFIIEGQKANLIWDNPAWSKDCDNEVNLSMGLVFKIATT
jgi:hypothetical protein